MARFHFNYIGRTKVWFAISGVIIVLGLLAIWMGGLKWGVEFQGGNQYNVIFKKAPTVSEVRATMEKLELGESTIQPVGSGTEVSIRTTRLPKAEQAEIKTALQEDFQVKEINMRDIGPNWGQQVTDGAIKALIVSLIVILLYVSIRFEFKMAIAIIIALLHDGLIVIGVYSLVGLVETKLGINWIPTEVTPNTVAALLTILGFSLYDTIVVFHRIRENTMIIGKRTYSMMTNDSINQVIMRSVNTSLTELVPVIALLFFGGETLKDFGFAMFVGLISGVYSSIFIAAPVLALLKEAEPRYRMIREKLAATREVASKSNKQTSRNDAMTSTAEVASLPKIKASRNDGKTRTNDDMTSTGEVASGEAQPRNDGTTRPKTAAQKAKKKAKKKKKR